MKNISREHLLNGWLKYHNITVEELLQKHAKEELQSPEWFKLYPCTQEQCDEWEVWAKKYIKKVTKLSNRIINNNWGLIYLDCSPYIKTDE